MQGMEKPHESVHGFEDPVAALASERFGIDYLFPLQRMAIANILDGMESEEPLRQLVLFPTGFGKSLCFQLPALLAEAPTVVVYPLLALMNDQRRSLERRGIPSVIFRGGMDKESRKAAREDLRSGKARIAITNPESLASGNLKDFLADLGVFHMAIDEAHCVSEWGETFRPSYLELGACIQAINPAVVSAFTATAGPEVRDAVTRHLFGNASCRMVTADMDKPNIFYRVVPSLHPDRSLVNLAGSCRRPMIIFDQSRAGVRRLCELVKEATGFDVRFYHAGLDREEKDRVEAWFMESDDGVLCATCAYGMGVDKRNVRTVMHFSSPSSIEAYIQEAGRGGRDGERADAILIHDPGAISAPGGRKESGADRGTEGPERRDEVREERRRAFLRYAAGRAGPRNSATATSGCRRAALHELMGEKLLAPCSGCDRCEGTAREEGEGVAELSEFLLRNPGRFDERTAARLLAGSARRKNLLESPPAAGASGLLSGWSEAEVHFLVKKALALGIIEAGKPHPWAKGYRLRAGSRTGLG